jgi:hypothetical protein
MRNNTSIPAEMEFIFPTQSEVDAEDWVEEAPLSPEMEKVNDLLTAKVFDVEPRKAKLGALARAAGPVCGVCVVWWWWGGGMEAGL